MVNDQSRVAVASVITIELIEPCRSGAGKQVASKQRAAGTVVTALGQSGDGVVDLFGAVQVIVGAADGTVVEMDDATAGVGGGELATTGLRARTSGSPRP